MTRILVLNSGSSSLKYRLFDGAETVARGLVEHIGEPGGEAADHDAALRHVMDTTDIHGLAAVGHRVVHGGERFSAPTVIDDDVIAGIEALVPLAPLHNPAALAGIAVARKLLPDVPQIAVFDTAFHTTIPPEGVTWAIDTDLAKRWQIRRYGFHGTSHAYVARKTAELLGRDPAETNVITLHLGNGASACAVRAGRSVATSMGMSPLSGLVMGTRSRPNPRCPPSPRLIGKPTAKPLDRPGRVSGLLITWVVQLLDHAGYLLRAIDVGDRPGRKTRGTPRARI